jgi:hypothetical protein
VDGTYAHDRLRMSISISLLHSVSNLTGEQTPRTHPCCEVRERLKQNMDAYRQLWAGIRKSTSSSSSVGPPVWCPPKIKHLSGTQRSTIKDCMTPHILTFLIRLRNERYSESESGNVIRSNQILVVHVCFAKPQSS